MCTGVFRGVSKADPGWREGFTLVELLVVIAVIAILAALLLTALNRSKMAADSAVCKSNLRQLTLAMTMYTQQTGTYPSSDSWPTELQPFLGSPWPEQNVKFAPNGASFTYLGPRSNPFACPAYNRLRGAFTVLGGEVVGTTRGAYGYNASGLDDVQGIDYGHGEAGLPPLGLGGLNYPSGLNAPVRENQVATPSDMIAMGDASFDQNPLGGFLFLEFVFLYPRFYDLTVRGLPPGNSATQAMRQRHGGRWNIGFCDGHVETMRTSDLFNLSNSVVAMRWNNDHQPHNQGWFPPN